MRQHGRIYHILRYSIITATFSYVNILKDSAQKNREPVGRALLSRHRFCIINKSRRHGDARPCCEMWCCCCSPSSLEGCQASSLSWLSIWRKSAGALGFVQRATLSGLCCWSCIKIDEVMSSGEGTVRCESQIWRGLVSEDMRKKVNKKHGLWNLTRSNSLHKVKAVWPPCKPKVVICFYLCGLSSHIHLTRPLTET